MTTGVGAPCSLPGTRSAGHVTAPYRVPASLMLRSPEGGTARRARCRRSPSPRPSGALALLQVEEEQHPRDHQPWEGQGEDERAEDVDQLEREAGQEDEGETDQRTGGDRDRGHQRRRAERPPPVSAHQVRAPAQGGADSEPAEDDPVLDEEPAHGEPDGERDPDDRERDDDAERRGPDAAAERAPQPGAKVREAAADPDRRSPFQERHGRGDHGRADGEPDERGDPAERGGEGRLDAAPTALVEGVADPEQVQDERLEADRHEEGRDHQEAERDERAAVGAPDRRGGADDLPER